MVALVLLAGSLGAGDSTGDFSASRDLSRPRPLIEPSDSNRARDRGRLYNGVEATRDRGAGRVVDPQTWELDRLRDRRLGQSEFQLFQQERERELLLGGKDRRGAMRGAGGGGPELDAARLRPPPFGLSPLAGQVWADEQLLAENEARFQQAVHDLIQSHLAATRRAADRLLGSGEAISFVRRSAELVQNFYLEMRIALMERQAHRAHILGLPGAD